MNRHYLNRTGFNKLAQSIKDYINRKITGYDKLGTASTKNFTTYVSPTQTDQLPISSSVYSAMTNMLRGAYHPAGSKTIAELTSDLLVKANLGNVYKITEDGVTSDLFIGGAGQTIKTGDNAVVLYASEDTYMFSLESGVVDLDAYQKKELTSGALIEDVIPANARARNQLVTKSDVVGTDYFNYEAPNVVRYYSIPITKKQPQNIKMNAQLIFSTVPDTYLITVGAVGGFTMGAKAVCLNNWYDKLTGTWYDETNDVLWFRVNNYSAFTVKIIENVYMEFGSLSATSTEPSGASWTAPQTLITAADLTSSVTSKSTAPITSGGVYNASIKTKVISKTESSVTTYPLNLPSGSIFVSAVCRNYNKITPLVYLNNEVLTVSFRQSDTLVEAQGAVGAQATICYI